METLDHDACYRAVSSRDRRFDGVFYTAVTTTGIYCRPSCPALTPRVHHVTFHRTAAAAQAAGFRACRRCRPDATPGSPAWDVAADLSGRAMRLIADGVVEREGVEGLASRLGYTSRHLTRVLTSELGAGPLALARARRAQHARILAETTTMPLTDVAFAAGFASVRQFNETVRAVYAASPSDLRRASRGDHRGHGSLDLRLAVREPFDAASLLTFLAAHLVPGVERSGSDWYERTLRLPHGAGRVLLRLPAAGASPPREGPGFVQTHLELTDLRDVAPAVERCRRLLDADCDPAAVTEALSSDPWLGDWLAARPGLRVPGGPDGDEVAVRAVVGQQVSLSGAIRIGAHLVEQHGQPLALGPDDVPGRVDRIFPDAAVLAETDPDTIPMPRARGRALAELCRRLADGDVVLDRSGDRAGVREQLLAGRGIGPWTADVIALRALGDPDVFLTGDVGLRNAARARGWSMPELAAHAERWRPWRSYGLMHAWASLDLRPAPAAVHQPPPVTGPPSGRSRRPAAAPRPHAVRPRGAA